MRRCTCRRRTCRRCTCRGRTRRRRTCRRRRGGPARRRRSNWCRCALRCRAWRRPGGCTGRRTSSLALAARRTARRSLLHGGRTGRRGCIRGRRRRCRRSRRRRCARRRRSSRRRGLRRCSRRWWCEFLPRGRRGRRRGWRGLGSRRRGRRCSRPRSRGRRRRWRRRRFWCSSRRRRRRWRSRARRRGSRRWRWCRPWRCGGGRRCGGRRCGARGRGGRRRTLRRRLLVAVGRLRLRDDDGIWLRPGWHACELHGRQGGRGKQCEAEVCHGDLVPRKVLCAEGLGTIDQLPAVGPHCGGQKNAALFILTSQRLNADAVHGSFSRCFQPRFHLVRCGVRKSATPRYDRWRD